MRSLAASSRVQRKVLGGVVALGQPGVAAQVDGEPAPRAPEPAPRGGDAHGGEPLDRDAVAAQRMLEALVLECLARLQATDVRVRRGGDGQRRAAELVVLAGAGAFEAGQPCLRLGIAAGERGRREVVRADLDPPADRPRAGGDRVELRSQPIRCGLGVGVGGGDQAVRRQALGGQVHPEPARVADARLPRVDHAKREVARRGAGPSLGRVGAAVEHEQDLVFVAGDAVLRRERGDARADQVLLVAGGDDDTRAQAHGSGAPVSTRVAAGLVVLVAVVREHADGRAVAPVPDRERPAAVVDQAGVVEAVAPRHVLERVLADRRPEAGRDVPLRVFTGDRAAGDLAHLERLAPVLHGQVAAGGGVVRERHVAGGGHAVGAGAHAGIDHDPAVAHVQPRVLGQPGGGRDPAGHQDQVGGERFPVGHMHAVVVDRLDAGAEDERDAERLRARRGCVGPPRRRAALPAGSPRR